MLRHETPHRAASVVYISESPLSKMSSIDRLTDRRNQSSTTSTAKPRFFRRVIDGGKYRLHTFGVATSASHNAP